MTKELACMIGICGGPILMILLFVWSLWYDHKVVKPRERKEDELYQAKLLKEKEQRIKDLMAEFNLDKETVERRLRLELPFSYWRKGV